MVSDNGALIKNVNSAFKKKVKLFIQTKLDKN